MPDKNTNTNTNTNAYDDAPNATSKNVHGHRQLASRAVTINRPAQEVYAFFRDLTKAPLYVDGVQSVTMAGKRAHWVSQDGDKTFEWDSEITNDVPGKEITWAAVDPAKSGSGRVTFDEVAGRGTVLTLTIAHEQSFVGKVVAKLKQTDPAIRERRNLRRLKQLLETGEIATNARNQRMLAEENQ